MLDKNLAQIALGHQLIFFPAFLYSLMHNTMYKNYSSIHKKKSLL